MAAKDQDTALEQTDDQSTGEAAGTTSSTQQAESDRQPDPANDWEARAKGLQKKVQEQAEQLKALQNAQVQQSERADQVEGRASALEKQLATAVERLQESIELNQGLMGQIQEERSARTFHEMLTTDYPDLQPIAGVLQRADDPDRQREIFEAAREGLSSQVEQGARQVVNEQFAGATAGSSPAQGQGADTSLPSYEEVMEHVMDDDLAQDDPKEYAKWMEIYRSHPEMTYSSLGLGEFQDPMPNHYHTRAAAAGVDNPGAGLPGRPTTPGAMGPGTGIRHSRFNPEA